MGKKMDACIKVSFLEMIMEGWKCEKKRKNIFS